MLFITKNFANGNFTNNALLWGTRGNGKSTLIKSLFKEHAYKLNISSTKSMTGHLLGAAGVIETIACIMAVKNNIVPPTINHVTKDPEIDENLNLTLNKAEERTVNYALSNTFGFGGHNASILVKKHTE